MPSRRARSAGGACVIALAFTLLTPLAASAQADCSDRLTELERLVQSGDFDANVTSSIEAAQGMAQQMCDAGSNELANQIIDGAFAIVGQPQQSASGAAPAEPSRPKTELTIDYLAGEWCSRGTKNTQEVVPHVFAEDGSYKIGVPAGNGFGLYEGGDSVQDFRDNYDRLISKEADRFVVGDRGRYEYTFTRESCR